MTQLSAIDFSAVDPERISNALAGLTQSPRVTLKSLIKAQIGPIQAARQRGLRHCDIAAALTQAGCPISAQTLRKYLSQLRVKHATDSSMALTNRHFPPSNAPDIPQPRAAADAVQAEPTARPSLRRTPKIQSEYKESQYES